ncbi:MAG: hypothetical protein PHC90_05865 [Syntrophorhabdaceae bacterium]|nr:hypothetical protein [Syntrophorhabdaceae bacterium]
MARDEEIDCGIKAYGEALLFASVASTREDLAGVEESYWIAFNKLRGSPLEEHRLICAECLEAVARILDGEGRRGAGDDLRRQAETFRKPPTDGER